MLAIICCPKEMVRFSPTEADGLRLFVAKEASGKFTGLGLLPGLHNIELTGGGALSSLRARLRWFDHLYAMNVRVFAIGSCALAAVAYANSTVTLDISYMTPRYA